MPSSLRCSDEKGQDLVEYAIVLPVLMLMLLGIIEFAIVIFSYDTIANAAREGARVGIIHFADDPDNVARKAAVTDAVRTRALGLNQAELDVTVNPEPLEPEDDGFVRVEVTYNVKLMTGPIIQAIGGNAKVPLRTTATMRLE